MSLRKLYYTLPPSWRLLARKLYYLPIDTYETLAGKRHQYEPRKGDIYIGSGDFLAQGQHQLQLLKRYANLQSTDHVLDIGSGIGRTAVPLTTYLNHTGTYDGFDVVEKGVRWCQSTIGRDYPNFRFQYVPLNNDLYNTASQKAAEFTFPYADNQFDVSFLFSVFTHMKRDEIDHYLGEIARTLRPGGRCLATFFLYNDHNEEQIATQAHFNFPAAYDGYRLMDPKVEGANIALAEKTLDAMLAEKSLRIQQTVHGYWKNANGKTGDNSYQDVVILERV